MSSAPPTPRQSTASPNTTLSSIHTRQQLHTESSLSPFFFRLDDSISRPSSIRFSTVSSISSNPDPPNPTAPRPTTPREPISWSAFARRQWSRLSQLASDDADSVVSEPASYSNAAYVASDLWLVQKDVPTAEKEITERGRRRREKMNQMPQRSWTAEYRNEETGSSRLISQFFSGRNNPTVGPTRQDRKDDTWGSAGISAGIRKGLYERQGMERSTEQQYPRDGRFEGRYYEGRHYEGRHYEGRYDRWADEQLQFHDGRVPLRKPHPQFQEQEFGPYVRRRFSRARKFRWWLRRVTHRVRNDWEYNM